MIRQRLGSVPTGCGSLPSSLPPPRSPAHRVARGSWRKMQNANVNFAKRPTLMRGSPRWAAEEQKQRRSDGEPVCGLALWLTMAAVAAAAAVRADKSEGGHANNLGQCVFLFTGGADDQWVALLGCSAHKVASRLPRCSLSWNHSHLRKSALRDVTKYHRHPI